MAGTLVGRYELEVPLGRGAMGEVWARPGPGHPPAGCRVGSELFMVMELAEGMPMAATLRQRQANGLGKFPVESVLRIAKQTCSGLAAAHAIGVVHRDIKPSNLMVSARGHLTVVDFGIARLLEDNSPRLTAQAETVGTLLYMSPEQAAGIDVDLVGSSDNFNGAPSPSTRPTGAPSWSAAATSSAPTRSSRSQPPRSRSRTRQDRLQLHG